MSHIPAAAMPHAKPHETAAPAKPAASRAPLPWAALVAGGVLAIGGAATAAWLLRSGRRTPTPARRAVRRKTAAKTPAKGTVRTRKPKARTDGEVGA